MKNWKLLKSKRVYDGYRKVERRTFEFPDGKQADFDVVLIGNPVSTFAITEDQKVVCFKTFRPGPAMYLYELPGGGIEEGEEPQDAAARELLEEVGYEAELEWLGQYYKDAYTDGYWHMFLGRNARKVAEPTLDPSEWGETVELELPEFMEILHKGLLTDSTNAYAALNKLNLL